MLLRNLILAAALWGASLGARSAEIFGTNSTWRYYLGTQEASTPAEAWQAPEFDDSGWSEGMGPIGYPSSPTQETNLVTIIPSSAAGGWVSVYFRKIFVLSNPADLSELDLGILIDDSYLAWINGYYVGSYNIPANAPPGVELPYNAPDLYTPWTAIEQTPTTLTVTNDLSRFLIAGTNVVAVHVFNANRTSSDLVFDASLSGSVDVVPPTVVRLIPAAGAVVTSLAELEVLFSEDVAGVDASDLRVNGQAATSVDVFSQSQYVFQFPQPATGTVQVAWSSAHGIHDLATTPNPFAGGAWQYTLDPQAIPPGLMITEFMADNKHTYRDETGQYVDWIEIYSGGATAENLAGWRLTDRTNDLARWTFPAYALGPGAYLVVFATGTSQTNTLPFHTSFQLNKDGGYLALVNPAGQVVSEFAPAYPKQYADVSYGRDAVDARVLGYFPTPTPGQPNQPGGPGFAPDVAFSLASTTFTNAVSLALSTPSSSAVIHYELSTNLPTELSPVYAGPMSITNTVFVRARAFEPGLLPGAVRSETYVQLAANVQSFASDLPLMILHNFGRGVVPADTDQFVAVQVFEPHTGPSSLTRPPDLAAHGIFHKRGSSTLGLPKASFFLETQDEYFRDRKVPLVGLPDESDWVLYAPNNFEPVLIHNPTAYALSRQVGRYASRTRFVEVYLKDDSGAPGPITSADYNGIYVLEEKIKIGNHRVDIDKLQPENAQPPWVTGGYLLSIDRAAPGAGQFSGAGMGINYLDPDYFEIIAPQRAAQQQYINNYFTAFGNALGSANWQDPVAGYAAYIDADSWIDHSVLNVVTFNVDALRLSGYFFKPRNGRITMGPVWDFDRTQGSTDGRDYNPRVFQSRVGDLGTDFFNFPWWGQLFTDPDFWQKWIDRYQDLRETTLANTNVQSLIDSLVAQVRTAQPRELSRWGNTLGSRPRSGTVSIDGFSYTFNGTYQGEVNFMKAWYSNRLDFIDTNLLHQPIFSRGEGPIPAGSTLTLTAPAGATVYYTLNGIDPRASGGALAPGALAYSGPIPINANARVVARARDLTHQNLTGAHNPPISSPWSGPIAGTFVVQTPPLRITEIMYHPAPAPAGNTNDVDNFEYLEVKNVGASTLNLAGFRLSGGIDTVLNNVTLGAGQRAVVVRDLAAFQSRYGSGASIAGTYTNNLANDGDHLVLQGPLLEPILDFSYRDDWYPITDGHGFSLAVVDELAATTNWSLPTQWRPNGTPGGTPGAADTILPAFPDVLINEALAHTDLPQVDTVELYNAGTTGADIGGWFLTDDVNEPTKFRIPDGTTIAAGGYATFDQPNLHPTTTNGFLLSEFGDNIHLFSGDVDTNLTGYVQGFSFGASLNGVSFGRYVTSVGEEDFVAQSAVTLGATNAGPRVGPVVINEIMYHPPPVYWTAYVTNNNTRDEYVELRNITGSPVPLYDPAATNQFGVGTNTWHLRGGIEFDFPPQITLPPDGYLLVVSFDPILQPGDLAAFRTRYNLDPGAVILGPYHGQLENLGESVRLHLPGVPEKDPGPLYGYVPYVLVDEVDYLNTSPWPTNASGTGNSLQRIVSNQYGNDPINWQAAPPTPGAANPIPPTVDTDGDGLPDAWEIANGLDPKDATGANGAQGDPDGDGMTNLQEYLSGTDPQDPQSFLKVDSITSDASGVELVFRAVAGRTYSVQYRDPTGTNTWQKLRDVPAQPVTGALPVTDPQPLTAENRFYRLVTPAQP